MHSEFLTEMTFTNLPLLILDDLNRSTALDFFSQLKFIANWQLAREILPFLLGFKAPTSGLLGRCSDH